MKEGRKINFNSIIMLWLHHAKIYTEIFYSFLQYFHDDSLLSAHHPLNSKDSFHNPIFSNYFLLKTPKKKKNSLFLRLAAEKVEENNKTECWVQKIENPVRLSLIVAYAHAGFLFSHVPSKTQSKFLCFSFFLQFLSIQTGVADTRVTFSRHFTELQIFSTDRLDESRDCSWEESLVHRDKCEESEAKFRGKKIQILNFRENWRLKNTND